MKAVPFVIPNTGNESIRIQEDSLDQFYPHFHEHTEMQLSWIMRGQGTLFVEHDMISFKENNIFLIGAKQAHVFKSVNTEGKGIKSLGIYFDPFHQLKGIIDLPECIKIKRFLESQQTGVRFPNHAIDALKQKMTTLKKAKGIDKVNQFLSLLEFIVSLKALEPLTSSSVNQNLGRKDERIQRIVEFSFANFKDEITLKHAASLINMTAPSFSRLFKQRTGKTFISYLNTIRINHACQLLTANQNPINEIAYACGFNHVQHFNRTFKAQKGMSPRKYIAQQ